MTTHCTSCIGNLELEDGECEFEGCEDDMVLTWSNGVPKKVAKCLMCEDGHGMSRDSTCIECDEYEVDNEWEDCLECAIDNNNKPLTCTVCEEGKELIPNGKEIPLFYCGFHTILECHLQVGQNCTECNDGFYRQYNEFDYDNCAPCDIGACELCEPIDGWLRSSCTKCSEDHHLVSVRLDGQTTYNRCDWNDDLINLENCEEVDPFDRSVCSECDDSYIWDPIQKICDECSEIIPDCHKCSFADDG